MADDETAEQPDVVRKKTSPLIAVIVLIAAGVGGYFTGTSVLAPKVIAAKASEGEAGTGGGSDAGAAADGHGAASGEQDDRSGEDGHFVELGNILVNPRDSRGLRFLMTTVALELEDAETRGVVLQREVQARDVIISVLERHTLDQLAAPGGRDSIRVEIRKELLQAFHLTWLSVYIPQYVIN